MKGRVQLYLVCLVLFQDSSNGQINLDICENLNGPMECSQRGEKLMCCENLKRVLGKRCASSLECNLERCRLDTLFKRWCENDRRVSIWENSKISCSKDGNLIYDVQIQMCCISKDSFDTETEHKCGEESEQTCGVEIFGTKFQVTMSTSCCDAEVSDCIDYDDASSISTSTSTSTSSNPPATPSASTPSALFTSTRANPPKTEAETTSIGTNGQEGIANSKQGTTDTGTLAGGIVGGLLAGVVITVVVVVVWWSRRRRRQRSDEANSKQTCAGPSKTNTQPVVVPDVIETSSSGLDEDYHEYHVISESQSRKPETGDYVDIKDEDLQGRDPGYEVAEGLAKVSSSQVEIKEQKSVKGKVSTGRMDSNVNDDEYSRLGDRANRGTDYDKIGKSGGL